MPLCVLGSWHWGRVGLCTPLHLSHFASFAFCAAHLGLASQYPLAPYLVVHSPFALWAILLVA